MQTDTLSIIPVDFAEAREPVSDAARQVLAAAEEAKASRDGLGGIKGLQMGKSDTYEVSPYDIHVKPGWNGRDFSLPENQDHVEVLAHSIAVKSVQVPLTVYLEGGLLYLSDGESRLRAVLYAINVLNKPVLSVPVRTEQRGSNDADRIAAQLIRNSGKPFNPLEKASVVRRLMGFGWTPEKVAAEVGLRPGRISELLKLLELPEPVRQRVQQGAVAASEAVRIVREHGDAAPALVERAVALSSENGGKKAGRATRATLAAAEEASSSRPERLTHSGLLSILRDAEAIEETDGSVSLHLSGDDWARITAIL